MRGRESSAGWRCTAIADDHDVTQEQVRESLAYRRPGFDLAVLLSFAVLYCLAASCMAGRLRRRFPFDEGWMAGAATTAIASAVVSLAGVMVGEIWSTVLEEIRIGNGHLSYRVARIPWTQHRLSLFAGGIILFWLIAGLQHHAAARQVPAVRGLKLNPGQIT